MVKENTYGFEVDISAKNKKEIIFCIKKEIASSQNNLKWQTNQSEEYLQRAKDLKERLVSLKKLLKELK